MKTLLDDHKFWACVTLLGMIMAMITGHKMVIGHKADSAEEN